MLIPRPHYQWTVALHRFIEVSIGIAVGLAISAVWPEPKSAAPTVAPTKALPASPYWRGDEKSRGKEERKEGTQRAPGNPHCKWAASVKGERKRRGGAGGQLKQTRGPRLWP